MIGTPPKVYTRLLLSTVTIPPTSDFDLSETVELIGDATDLRRTVNGEPVNVARAVFRKYSVSISASDLRAAGVFAMTPGDYVECVPSEPFSVSVKPAATSVELPRSGIEVIGITASGAKIGPTAQPVDRRPLEVDRDGDRIADLRLRPTVTFASPVTLVRFRPILACVVTNWSTSADERAATASWSLNKEEI